MAAPKSGFSSEAAIDDFLHNLPHSVNGTYRANTSCVQIEAGTKDVILCDAGTGIRDFALTLSNTAGPKTYHIFLSHLHWDHIQGFPFFAPAYQAGNKIIFHSFHKETEATIRRQMDAPCFPVPYACMQADIEFDIRDEGDSFQIEGLEISTIKQQHPGDSWGYRFKLGTKSIVYSTDAEHSPELESLDSPFIPFFQNADILILDGQYSLEEAMNSKRNWGHSNHHTAVKLASLAKVKQLVLYHHEPSYTDSEIEDILKAAKADRQTLAQDEENIYPLTIISAYDGLTLST